MGRDDFVFEGPATPVQVHKLDRLAKSERELEKRARRTLPLIEAVTAQSRGLYAGTREMSDSMNYFIAGLSIIGGESVASSKILRSTATAVQATAAAFAVYESVRAVREALKAREAAAAAVETAAYAATQQWLCGRVRECKPQKEGVHPQPDGAPEGRPEDKDHHAHRSNGDHGKYRLS